MNSSPGLQDRCDHELRFQFVHDAGRALAFPCDADGHVDLDALGDRARRNYLYARTLIGREFLTPAICHFEVLGDNRTQACEERH